MTEMTKIPQSEIEAYHAGYTTGYEVGKCDAMKWISVKERLPEDTENYFVYTDEDHIHIATYTGERWYDSYSGDYIRDGEVTHWMPKPEPPEVENET